jgi:hypothetical protein
MAPEAWNCGIGRRAIGRLVRLAMRQPIEDVVVLLQSIHHHIEDGLSPIEATLSARHEQAVDQRRRLSTRSRASFRGEVS